MTMRGRSSGLSDVGVIRSHNEDCFDIDPKNQVFVVADGMGGHSHGEIASRIAVDAIRDFVEQTNDADSTLPFEMDTTLGRHGNRLRAAIRIAHDKVLRAILKNVVTRALGGEAEIDIDVRECPIEAGDLFLLCSDGLTTMLTDDEIVSRVRSVDRLEEACSRLVRDANSRGGYDNVSVVLVRIEEGDEDGDSDG
jgi:serine/threonine protein phosphatase PrpC